MHLSILPENQEIREYYTNHSTYHDGDAGLDLFLTEDVTIGPNETILLNLHIKCSATSNNVPVSYYLYPRSSISKTPLRMSNSVGIIDAGYRGDIKVSMDNISSEPYMITKGSRLFQICSPTLEPIQFDIVSELTSTNRGEGGFGSTN